MWYWVCLSLCLKIYCPHPYSIVRPEISLFCPQLHSSYSLANLKQSCAVHMLLSPQLKTHRRPKQVSGGYLTQFPPLCSIAYTSCFSLPSHISVPRLSKAAVFCLHYSLLCPSQLAFCRQRTETIWGLPSWVFHFSGFVLFQCLLSVTWAFLLWSPVFQSRLWKLEYQLISKLFLNSNFPWVWNIWITLFAM